MRTCRLPHFAELASNAQSNADASMPRPSARCASACATHSSYAWLVAFRISRHSRRRATPCTRTGIGSAQQVIERQVSDPVGEFGALDPCAARQANRQLVVKPEGLDHCRAQMRLETGAFQLRVPSIKAPRPTLLAPCALRKAAGRSTAKSSVHCPDRRP